MVYYNVIDMYIWCFVCFFVCVVDYFGNIISYIWVFSWGLFFRDGFFLGNGKGNIFLDIDF